MIGIIITHQAMMGKIEIIQFFLDIIGTRCLGEPNRIIHQKPVLESIGIVHNIKNIA